MLKITPQDYAALRLHGEETYPHECCGVLLGRVDDDGTRIVTSTARCGYHSHPDHPARWSPTDLAEAHWFGCSYVITSVDKGKAAITNSFELAGTEESDKQLIDDKIQVS
jgi:proteasome lid subunit RPN8/RPN11